MKTVHVYESIKNQVPPPLRSLLWFFAHQVSKRSYQKFFKKVGVGRIQSMDPGPVPPKELITTTSLLRQEDIYEKSDKYYYYASGCLTMLRFLKKLHDNDFDFRGSHSVLEIGCGTARVLRNLRWFSDMQLVGTDLNRKCIDWCRLNLKGIEFHVNDLNPPLKFAENDQFDFVYAQSVFTHIPPDSQAS